MQNAVLVMISCEHFNRSPPQTTLLTLLSDATFLKRSDPARAAEREGC
jgi:hypothetical protein